MNDPPLCWRDRLVADWGTITKFWSVRWAALGTFLLPIMTVVPSLPNEVQALLPPTVRVIVTGLWSLIYIALRVWPQKKLNG
jgi:uncharacterized membrane-anchored protein